jgi:endonuclease III-like uncharacterized protein
MLRIRLETSPWNTRQEQLRDNPWQMMIVCMMLNQTNYKQVEKVRYNFFDRFPTPEELMFASDEEIIEIIRSLGFYNRRAKQWKQFSREWLELTDTFKDPVTIPVDRLGDLTGVGKYALDSWKIFQLYDYSVDPEDHVLNWYIDWARQEVEKIEREQNEPKATVVYYLHYEDEREMQSAWSKRQDFVCCVWARTHREAIEKTKRIAGGKHIKIMGLANGKPEWVNETKHL